MNRKNCYISIFIIVITFLLLHEPLLIGVGNISALLRKNNESVLDKRAYEIKIENLEKQLLEYESSYENLKIFDNDNYVKGKVSLRNIYDFYDFIIINTDTRVNKETAVINENGLIGIVESIDGNLAKTKLLTKNSTSVKVGSSYGLMDEYIKKDNVFIIHNINNYAKINIGDEVVTSGLTSFTANLKIGKVIKVETKDIERLVYVMPYVNFDDINYVYVIDKW